MDRQIVLTLTSRQRDMFDDVQLIVDDVTNDMKLAQVIVDGIIGTPPPPFYQHAEDIIAILEDELREMLRTSGIYDSTRAMSIITVERSPRLNVLTIYLRIKL